MSLKQSLAPSTSVAGARDGAREKNTAIASGNSGLHRFMVRLLGGCGRTAGSERLEKSRASASARFTTVRHVPRAGQGKDGRHGGNALDAGRGGRPPGV